MTLSPKGAAMVTGASSGIGAVYADKLAQRGHDLVLVARNRTQLDEVARHVVEATGRNVEVITANLKDRADLSRIEALLRTDSRITMLVNNAGIGALTPLLQSDVDAMEEMIELNVTALTRLIYAVAPAFVARGGGTIINIASIVAIAPETLNGVYGATKAFVLALSLSLHKELTDKNLRVQVVLPGATATAFWEAAGGSIHQLPSQIVMQTEDMVDAALAGLDQGELVTIPSLQEAADWHAFEAARQKLIPYLSLSLPASRYRIPSTTLEETQRASP